MACKGKYRKWLQPHKLAEIENMAAKGMTNVEMAKSMGITETTFYDWSNKYPEFSKAVETGRARSITCVENMLFKKAMGEVSETTELVEDTDGKVHKRKVVHKALPDTASIIFILKNRGGYSDNPNATKNEQKQVNVTVGDLGGMTDEQLRARAAKIAEDLRDAE